MYELLDVVLHNAFSRHDGKLLAAVTVVCRRRPRAATSRCCPWDEQTCWYAAEGGETAVLKWTVETGCPGAGNCGR